MQGPFSRYDYQRTPAPSSIKSFKSVLPASASDVYYRDEIGNISTSNLWSQEDSVELELRPRFPLFGGWQTRFYMGYNVPSYEYLYNLGESSAVLCSGRTVLSQQDLLCKKYFSACYHLLLIFFLPSIEGVLTIKINNYV